MIKMFSNQSNCRLRSSTDADISKVSIMLMVLLFWREGGLAVLMPRFARNLVFSVFSNSSSTCIVTSKLLSCTSKDYRTRSIVPWFRAWLRSHPPLSRSLYRAFLLLWPSARPGSMLGRACWRSWTRTLGRYAVRHPLGNSVCSEESLALWCNDQQPSSKSAVCTLER